MLKKTAVLLYPLFSEYELSVALSVLMQGGKEVVTIGLNDEPVKGESGLNCIPDKTIDNVNIDEIDSLILPGCLDIGVLQYEEKLFEFINRIEPNLRLIASISSSPYILARAGLLEGIKYTVGLSREALESLAIFDLNNFSTDVVVYDGKFITARGRGFITFALEIGKSLELKFDSKWYGHN